ncbi:MAG TPA: CocE/NonD family hydrolase [Acidimicrobiia bacterium]|nr:CocE/NonD family hydrolase [Acidimicrobiia bacterium]
MTLTGKHTRSEVIEGIRVDWHVPIEMDDGNVLDADVYRPDDNANYPVILSHGIYAKGLAFQDEIYETQWTKLVSKDPSILEGSSNRFQSWEVVDPERWVPDGYVVVRVDSRGAGWSPGYLNPRSSREIDDFVRCIEWAGTQGWSNGKVGLCGISYYALSQWLVASRSPRYLVGIIPWEGYVDYYRGPTHHGGIRSEFQDKWWERQVARVQHGAGEQALKNPNTGESIAGPKTLSEEELRNNRIDLPVELQRRQLDDQWYRERSADVTKISVPLLSAANWGGQGIHPTGNFEGFERSAATQKWLEVHGDTHYTHFYSSYGRALQKRFFDHFLKGIDNGWDKEPPVQLNIRRPGEDFELRMEHEWPLARTEWTRFHLDPENLSLERDDPQQPASIPYETMGDGVTFSLPVLDDELEVTGPMAAKLFISSKTADADLFLVLRLFDPSGSEVTFEGANDPNTPIAMGWLRASHREIDEKRSEPYRPYHLHQRRYPLTPGEIYELDVEIWPSCIVVPPGYRLALTVRGIDYEYRGELDEYGRSFYYATRGTGGMTHTDPEDRPPEIFDTTVVIHTSPEQSSYLLLPIIPPQGPAT